MRSKLLALVVAGVLALGACGGDDDDDASTDTTEGTEQTDDSGTDSTEAGDTESTEGGGGGDLGDYTQEEHDSFISGCTAGGAYSEEDCECGWQYIVDNVSAEEYRDVQADVASGEITSEDDLPDWVNEANEECGLE